MLQMKVLMNMAYYNNDDDDDDGVGSSHDEGGDDGDGDDVSNVISDGDDISNEISDSDDVSNVISDSEDDQFGGCMLYEDDTYDIMITTIINIILSVSYPSAVSYIILM